MLPGPKDAAVGRSHSSVRAGYCFSLMLNVFDFINLMCPVLFGVRAEFVLIFLPENIAPKELLAQLSTPSL